ncbi:MAG: hypothetical protein DHS20C21_20320 [Gemmatimonadota bacterium]|nr:MAG: hypothetical protein DHS20C21_20320 [Gemmatimonadota bacterium]
MVLLSTAVLLAEIRITPSASTVDSTVTVTMDVRNLHPSAAIDSVMPSALAPSGLGVLDPLTGPIPAEFSLGISEEKTFTWTYRAASSGDVRLSGSASGVEAGGGGSHASLPVTSNAHQIFVQAQDLNVFAVESMPFSISLGQTGVVPLSLTFENPAGVGGSDIRLLGLRIRLEDELGNTLVPSDLLARVVVNEGAVVYLDKSALETTATEMDLTLAQPVLIESSGSSSSATLAIALDISDSTSVPNFLMRVVDATWFEAEDATSGGPVIVSLIDPPAFPITSGLARVVAEATQVDVMNVAGSDFTVGQGQPDVAMLTIELDNPDPTGLAADARVTTFCVSLMDTAGVPIPAPAGWIQRIRVDGASLNHLNRSIGAADSSLISLALPQLVSVPVNTIVPLTVSVDVTSTSALGAFRMELADSSLFDARDANTGSPIPAIYSSHPVSGPLVTVESPANAAEAAGVARIPAEVSVGSVDVPALSVVLAHPGPGNSGPIRVDELTLLCRDGAGNALSPATFLDRVRVRVDSAGVALVTDLPGTGGQLSVPISAVSIAPFAQVSLDVYLDVEVTAPASLFAVQVAADGILAVDGNLSVPVAVGPASGAEFPLTSGFTQFRTPARDLVVAFQDAMPPVLVADEQTLEVMNLSLTNPTETGGDIRVNGFQFLGADRDRTPIDLGSAIASLQAWVGDSLWAETGPIDPAAVSVDLVAAESLLIAANTTIDVRVEVTLTGEPVDGGLRLGLDASGVSVVQPDSPLLVVSVQAAEGGAFPYWTESGNFSGVTLRESYSNFPNPFAAGREDTQIAFYLERAGQVSLKVYTLRGEPVRTLLNGASLGAGLHQDTTWDGRNGRGTVVLNGVYLAEISVKFDDGSGDRIVRKVAVVR